MFDSVDFDAVGIHFMQKHKQISGGGGEFSAVKIIFHLLLHVYFLLHDKRKHQHIRP
jgi:hypothetical protein